MFEKVTYTHYSSDLGRAVVPDEETFNKYKLLNIQLMKTWLNYVEAREVDGIDSAVCMMIEVDYVDDQLLNGDSSGAISSESLGGYSYSYGSVSQSKAVELNALSTDEKKRKAAKLFVWFDVGIK